MRAWILRHRRMLWVTWVLLAAVCGIEILILRQQGFREFDAGSDFLLWSAPFFLLGAASFPMIYASWFGSPPAGVVGMLKLAFFWMALAAFTGLVITIVWIFGL